MPAISGQWAKVLAIDMASVFQAAPGGSLDGKVGRRLRDEVYGVGHTHDVAESVEKFLGRARRNPTSHMSASRRRSNRDFPSLLGMIPGFPWGREFF
jgi:Zn-dependent oligopeptidase